MHGWAGSVRLLSLFLPIMLVLSIAGFSRCDAPRSWAEPDQAAPSPDAAVARFVEEGGGRFAGPCEHTRSPEDLGKVCARFIEERDGVHAYLSGRTFSEFTTWVFVKQTGAGWTAFHSVPLDFNSTDTRIPWP